MSVLTWAARLPSTLSERWKKNKWLLAYQVYNIAYDRGFYPFAIWYWGLAQGALIATIGSLIQNTVMFWWYDKAKLDWLSAQELRDLEKKDQLAWYERALVWFGQEKHTMGGKILSRIAFFFAATQFDPLIVAIHYQKRHFEGLRTRDWMILLVAVAAGNLWSTIETGVIVESARFLWEHRAEIGPFMWREAESLKHFLWENRDYIFRLLFGR